jgi:hypothetical protein
VRPTLAAVLAAKRAGAERRPGEPGDPVEGGGPEGANGAESNEEVWQAVKTLLQLHDYLQGTRSGGEQSPAASGPEGQGT